MRGGCDFNPREQDYPASGILFDLGSHLIHQALALFGTPKSVFCFQDNCRNLPETNSIDRFTVLLEYSHLLVTLKSTMLAKIPGPRFFIHGTEASVIIHGMDPQEDQLRGGMSPHNPEFGVTDRKLILNQQECAIKKGNYSLFYENVAEAIQSNNPCLLKVTPAMASHVVQIIEAAIASANSGCRKLWNEKTCVFE